MHMHTSTIWYLQISTTQSVKVVTRVCMSARRRRYRWCSPFLPTFLLLAACKLSSKHSWSNLDIAQTTITCYSKLQHYRVYDDAEAATWVNQIKEPCVCVFILRRVHGGDALNYLLEGRTMFPEIFWNVMCRLSPGNLILLFCCWNFFNQIRHFVGQSDVGA